MTQNLILKFKNEMEIAEYQLSVLIEHFLHSKWISEMIRWVAIL